MRWWWTSSYGESSLGRFLKALFATLPRTLIKYFTSSGKSKWRSIGPILSWSNSTKNCRVKSTTLLMMSMCILQHMEVIFVEKKIDNPEQSTSPKGKKKSPRKENTDKDSRHKFITEHIQSKTVTREDSPLWTRTRKSEIEDIIFKTPE